jgi:hypothetical protein
MSVPKELADLLYELALPSSGRTPGDIPTVGMERAFAMAIANHLEYAEDSKKLLLEGLDEGSAATRIGRGFASSVMVNTGNKYGVIGLLSCLRSFEGEEVSEEVGELLGVLEKHLRAGGGTITSQEGSPSSP